MKRAARPVVVVAEPVSGGVVVPFSAVCVVNRKPFAGTVTVTWSPRAEVPEYGAVARIVATASRRPTTCEALAIAVRRAMARRAKKRGRGVVVRVDVTSEAHLRAWAVAG